MSIASPIYLFADSSLLYWQTTDSNPWISRIWNSLDSSRPRAAYLGASNGDDPEFYSIFEAAMASVSIHDCRMIRSGFSREDADFLHHADVILLAGGDVGRGWRVFQATGIKDVILERYHQGAILMGISAGAIQLGYGFREIGRHGENQTLATFQFVKCWIDAHDEQQDWVRLRETVTASKARGEGIGIPARAGAIVHPDQSLEVVRLPLRSMVRTASTVEEATIAPPKLLRLKSES